MIMLRSCVLVVTFLCLLTDHRVSGSTLKGSQKLERIWTKLGINILKLFPVIPCGGNRYIQSSQLCDGIQDCEDGFDEEICDERVNTADVKPSEGDEGKPSDDEDIELPFDEEAKPQTGNKEPAIDDSKSQTDEKKPQTDESKPVTDDTIPQTDDTKPDANDIKPQTDDTKPDSNDIKPQTDDTRPQTDDTKLDTNDMYFGKNDTEPNAEDTKPLTDVKNPLTDDTKPLADDTSNGTKADNADYLTNDTENTTDDATTLEESDTEQNGTNTQQDDAKPLTDVKKPVDTEEEGGIESEEILDTLAQNHTDTQEKKQNEQNGVKRILKKLLIKLLEDNE